MHPYLQTMRTQFNTARLALRYGTHWRYVLRMVRGYLRVNLLRQEQLRFVEIFVTLACNARCEFCSNGLFTSKKTTLSKEKYLDLIDQCAALDVPLICLIGGEPLLYKHLNELIARIDRRGMLSAIATNGYLLDRDHARELAGAGLKNVVTSVLSPYPEKHDAAYKLPGSWERILAAKEYCREFGMTFGWATVVSHDDFADGTFDDLVALAERHRVPMSINPIIPTGYAKDSTAKMLTQADVERLDELARGSTYISTHLTNNYFGFGCPAGNSYLGVNATGEIFPCFFCPTSLGNVERMSLREAWERACQSPLFTKKHKMCFLGVSREFFHEYLKPALEADYVPMPIEDHPKFDRSLGGLADLERDDVAGAVGYEASVSAGESDGGEAGSGTGEREAEVTHV